MPTRGGSVPGIDGAKYAGRLPAKGRRAHFTAFLQYGSECDFALAQMEEIVKTFDSRKHGARRGHELNDRSDLSIVIPSYNEESRLPETLQRIAEYLPTLGLRTEVLVVDDGSTDRTAAVAESFRGEVSELRMFLERHKSRKRL